MKRRLGSSGIFVEINGKYYLDESRLKQIQAEGREGISFGSSWSLKRRMLELRIARMVLGVIVVALVLYDLLYVGEAELRFLIVGLLSVWLALTLIQLYWMSRIRAGMGSAP